MRNAAPADIEQVGHKDSGHKGRGVQDHFAPDNPVHVQQQPQEDQERNAARHPFPGFVV